MRVKYDQCFTHTFVLPPICKYWKKYKFYIGFCLSESWWWDQWKFGLHPITSMMLFVKTKDRFWTSLSGNLLTSSSDKDILLYQTKKPLFVFCITNVSSFVQTQGASLFSDTWSQSIHRVGMGRKLWSYCIVVDKILYAARNTLNISTYLFSPETSGKVLRLQNFLCLSFLCFWFLK